MSKSVERFRAGEYVEVPIPDPQGKWVRWSDYEKLQSKLAQVEQERDAETERANRWEARAKQLGREVEKL